MVSKRRSPLIYLIPLGIVIVGLIFVLWPKPNLKSVRAIYLVPEDREYRPEYEAAIEHCLLDLQQWYSSKMGGRTFRLSHPIVQVEKTPHVAAWYNENPPDHHAEKKAYAFYNALSDAAVAIGVSEKERNYTWFNVSSDYVWIIYIDAPGGSGAGEPGVAVLPQHDLEGLSGNASDSTPVSRWIGGSGHELGHAFGLPHPGIDHKQAIMEDGYAAYPDCTLTDRCLPILDRSSFFHEDSANRVDWKRKIVRLLPFLILAALVTIWIWFRAGKSGTDQETKDQEAESSR